MIYLDNNATTFMPPDVKNAFLEWCNRGNPSSGYASAKAIRRMMQNFREYIGKICGIDPCCPEMRDSKVGGGAKKQQDPTKYKIIFTSGATEANCTGLHCVVRAYEEITETVPHIIMSAVEHKSLMEFAKSYEARGIAEVTFIKPTPTGHIRPRDVANAVRDNTCIICVMHANNETGAINDIRKIGAVAHRHNIPFYCDTVQTFGKTPINPLIDNVDLFCASFHKLQGPPGVGILVIKQQLLIGYQFSPLLFGSQNESFRGGTENVPGIGAAFAALKLTMAGRTAKNAETLKIKRYIMKELSLRIPARHYSEYHSGEPAAGNRLPEVEIIFLSGVKDYLSNTILLSVVKRTKPMICNIILKTELEKKHIIVSVGSACNTSSASASHVLDALDADVLIRKGALRISLGDKSTMREAETFVETFLRIVDNQMKMKK